MGDLFRPLSQAALKTSKLIERLDELRADDDANDLNSKIDTWYSLPGQWLARFEAGAGLCERYRSALGSEAVSEQDDQRANFARWCRYYPKQQDLELFAAPILAGDMLYDSLWSQCAGAALVSATLRTLGSFERLRQRAGLPDEFESLALPSPFRFQDNAVLHIPKEAADPRDTNAHDTYILDTLPKRLDIKKGNLVLFSSARQMDWVFDHLATDWQKQVLVQGSRSKQKLIETHKSRIDDGRGSTLFGLASFAEGLDLAGHYCEHVVIAKLPFSVPTDPEAEALAEWIEAHGGNAFRDMSLADASLRLVQAVGRLLRSDQDRGQITVMDNRLLTKAYGKQLLADLPPMPIVYD